MTVKQQQCLLIYLGYDPGPVDGVAGVKTNAALASFTADYGSASLLLAAVAGTASKLQKPVQQATASATVTNVGSKTGTFWDSIKYFQRDEFRCKCGGKYCNGFPAEPTETLVRNADKVREHFAKPATVSSGVRDKTHNLAVGGANGSYHTLGRAMDFAIKGVPSAQVLAYVQTLKPHYAYAINNEYVHMDF